MVMLERTLMIFGCIVLLAVTLIQVVCRYLLFIATPWCEELARYSFMWTAFIGMGYITNSWSHLNIEIIDTLAKRLFKKNSEKILDLVYFNSHVISLVLLLVSIGLYVNYASRIYPSKSTVLGLSIQVPLMSTFIGLVLMAFHIIVRLILWNRNKEKGGEEL